MKILFALLLLTAAGTAQVRTDFDRKMNEPVEPFQIIDNIYYVGASDTAVYLITTPKGHILIDGGFRETVPQIEANISKLGFKLTDIKILLNNHAHSDHAGGLALLKEKTGAKLYAPKKQATQLKRGGKKDFAFGDKMTFDPVKPNRRLRDLDRVRLGGTTLVTHLTPGHTKGCTTFTTTARHEGAKYQVMFLCSLTALNYDLVDNENYGDIAKDFEMSFDKLRSMKVDVFLASHASFFKMKQKLSKRSENGGNPFVDPEGYRFFITRVERDFRRKLNEQMKKKGN